MTLQKITTTSWRVIGIARFENFLERFPALCQAEVLEQEGHQVAVSPVANGAVVELPHAAVEGIAERAQAAGRIERLVVYAVQGKRFQAVQRQGLDPAAIVDRLAGIAVLVDQAVRRPGEVVIQGIRGKFRQGAHAHVDRVQTLEPPREVISKNRDEAGGQAALGHENLAGTSPRGQVSDRTGRIKVFGQVEVTCARPSAASATPGL